MATKNPTIVLGATWSDGVDSLTEMIDGVEDMLIGDFDRDNMDRTSASVITISAAAPTGPGTGEIWLDTSGTPYELKFFDGSVFVAVAFAIEATAPTTPAAGQLWKDTTLNLLRQYGTQDGITGWHPVDSNYQLWQNHEGGSVVANSPVILDAAASTGTTVRNFEYTSAIGDQMVIGVTLESSDNGDDAVIAITQGNAIVDVLVNGVTRTVSRNDFLATSGTNGEARTFGPRKPDAYVSDNERWVGEPTGAFAIALDSQATNAVVSCQMLGHIGAGMDVWFDREVVGAGDTVSVSGIATSAWTEADITTNLKDTDHSPILGAYLDAQYLSDPDGTTGSLVATILLSVDQVVTHKQMTYSAGSASGGLGNLRQEIFMPTVDDSTGTATARGELFSFQLSVTDASGSPTGHANMFLRGYRV